MIIPDDFPLDLELKIYNYIKYEIPEDLLQEIKDYYKKNTEEYKDKLLDS